MLKYNNFLRLILLYIIILISCSKDNLNENSINAIVLSDTSVCSHKFQSYKNFSSIKNIDDTLRLFRYGYYYYFFLTNRQLDDLKVRKEMSNYEINDIIDKRNNLIFSIIDDVKKEIRIFRNVSIKDYISLLTTDKFLCFQLTESGYKEVWPKSKDIYTIGTILIFKKTPYNFKYYSYPSETINNIQETFDGKLRIVTTKMEIVYPILDRLANKISNHFPIGYYRSFGEYYEYLYDSTLKQISRKSVDNFE
jgi:hypothetical protein